MNLGVYKNFTAEDEEEGLIAVLKNLESRSDVKEVKIKFLPNNNPFWGVNCKNL